jgi:hypothetical protein
MTHRTDEQRAVAIALARKKAARIRRLKVESQEAKAEQESIARDYERVAIEFGNKQDSTAATVARAAKARLVRFCQLHDIAPFEL